MPPSAPLFKLDQKIRLNITKKRLMGPKKIDLPVIDWYTGVYRKYSNPKKDDIGKAWKSTPDSQPYQVDLTFVRPVKVFGSEVAGAVTYVLHPE